MSGRLPLRTRRHLSRLGVHVVRMLEALAAPEQPRASVRPSTSMVQ